MPVTMQPVWSVGVRLLHWTLAIAMIVGFATHEDVGQVHFWAGYVALGAASWRLALGLVGPSSWRFERFLRGPGATLRYAQSVARHAEPRYVGHNPLGGWMVMAMLTDAVVVGVSGWLYTTDRFFGVEWVETVHTLSGQALPILLILHVAGVVFTSRRHQENLVAAMLHGKKPAAAPGDHP